MDTPAHPDHDLRPLLEQVRAAHRRQPPSYRQRMDDLARLGEVIRSHRDELVKTVSADFDLTYRPTDSLSVHFKAGWTKANGDTSNENFIEFAGPGAFSYDLTSGRPEVSFASPDPLNPAGIRPDYGRIQSVTNDDEANIMSAMLAKRMGAQKTMVLIKRGAYVDLLQGGEVDIAVSPQQATISALLTHIRRGDIVNVYSLRRGAAEAIEAVARGDASTSKVVGKAIGELRLPPGTTIGAIVRGEEVLIAHDNTVIATDDHVILFMVDKKHIVEVERLFQVSAIFI